MNEKTLYFIQRELEILAKIDHPNIVKVHGAYQDEFKIYFLLDTFNGYSLFDRIIRLGQLSEPESALIIAHIFSALKFLHKNGYVHRNLRPETILFESDGALSDIKLVDLITCIETKDMKEEDPDYDLITKGSSPYYRAPELLVKTKHYGVNCDLWACGSMLYNMITGIPPFFEIDEEYTKEKIKSGILSCAYPNYEENSSKEIKELINSLLQVERLERFNID